MLKGGCERQREVKNYTKNFYLHKSMTRDAFTEITKMETIGTGFKSRWSGTLILTC